MSYQTKTSKTDLTYSLSDVIDWAQQNGVPIANVYEIQKIPARLGMIDDDIGLIAGNVEYFEKVIADSPFAPVSRSTDLEVARRRSNSRVRRALKDFEAIMVGTKPNDRDGYDTLIKWVKEREGFTQDGAVFSTSTHKCLFSLRARLNVPIGQISQVDVDCAFQIATVEKRKSLAKGVRLLERLKRLQNEGPELRNMLPAVNLEIPKTSDRAARIVWSSLPEGFRASAESAFSEALATPDDIATWVKDHMRVGTLSQELDRMIAERAGKRGRRPKNSASALAGYRAAVTWLARQRTALDGSFDELTTLKDLMTRDHIERTIKDQIDRSKRSLLLKDPAKSQTLANRMTNLGTVAKHGLHDEEIVAHLRVLRIAYYDFIITPKEMTEEADHTCRMLRDLPHLATAFVHSPATISRKARQAISDARMRKDQTKLDEAYRMFQSAVLHALQLSRPLRTSNLIALRHRGSPEISGNITWIKRKTHAEIKFMKGEIKNDRAVTVHVLGDDARLLWEWIKIHRPRFLKLRDLPDSPYVFPGAAQPRLVKQALTLPHGSIAPATMSELWAIGHEIVGLGLSPHTCRHAVATLILAVEPGNFAKAAAVLGDTEETVRKHYGCDSGEAAASAVRASLIAHHPDIMKRMKGIKT